MRDDEVDRLWESLQKPANLKPFVIFEAQSRRIALNNDHVQWMRFGAGAGNTTFKADASTRTVDLLVAGAIKPWHLQMEPDRRSLVDIVEGRDDDEMAAQLANLFFRLDILRQHSEEFQPLVDVAESVLWLRLSEIAFVSSPLDLLVPVLE